MKLSEFHRLYGEPDEIIPKLSRRFWIFIFRVLQRIWGRNDKPYFIASELTEEERKELSMRAKFYTPSWHFDELEPRPNVHVSTIVSSAPLLIFGSRSRFLDWLVLKRPGTFDLDYRTNPMDGWAWCGLAEYLTKNDIDLSVARECLRARIADLRNEALTRCYIFGTGPSLESAMNRQWQDGYRIVCNTIVRDPELWHHIKPHFIVAGDAIYHFGHTRFAEAFRHDLRRRLEESDTLFIYPSQFHVIVARELSGLENRLIPIPPGWRRKINIDLTNSFQLPNLGNVLGLLLLPLGCTLSKHLFLCGFDGRAPADKLFWRNSNKHTYMEFMNDLKDAHPRFFDHYVPASDPNKYIRDHQGDRLEMALQIAEREGWTFEMMHRSWTPTLQKRFHGEE